MQPAVQAKFLRVLQEGQFRRLGGKAELCVNVRVVAATNKDPLRAVREGALREDLYYRLNVFALTLPPLAQRLDDLADLVPAFLEEFNERYGRAIRGVSEPAVAALRRHRWPGNVRELRNVIERAVVVCGGDLIGPEHLPGGLTLAPAPAAPGEASVVIPIGTTVDEAERQLILSTLAHAGNNKTRAAEVLGISLKTLHNKLGRYQG
jgi:transcriptional regulator with PAS, ATPase and Fis domain